MFGPFYSHPEGVGAGVGAGVGVREDSLLGFESQPLGIDKSENGCQCRFRMLPYTQGLRVQGTYHPKTPATSTAAIEDSRRSR